MATSSASVSLNLCSLLDENVSLSTIAYANNDLQMKAQKELQEKLEWRERDIDAVRQMIIEQHLALKPCLSQAFLLRFLRVKKFDYERAMSVLINYYSIRYNHPDIFNNLKPSSITNSDALSHVRFLPNTDYHGRRILLISFADWDPDVIPVEELVKVMFLNLELEVCQESSQICGVSVIVDLRQLSIQQILQHFKPAFVRKIAGCLTNAFPLRLKGVHLAHDSTLLDCMITMIKPLMSDKLRHRLHFHGNNLQSLHQFVDADNLPESLGGPPISPNSERNDREQQTASSPHIPSCAFHDEWLRISAAEDYFVELSSFGFLEAPPTSTGEQEGALRSVLTTYKRFCIDGLNA